MKKTSVFQNSLIWFGAGVSIAEILTGTYFAPLGMAKGFAAILLGHLIGCTMMFFAGLIGGRTGLSAMETSKLSFGKKGSLWFAALNVLQLVGWTAIMIYDGALAANGIAGVGAWLWCLVIGALILVWILIGLTDLGRINQVVMVLLFVLTLVMCKVIFFGGNGIMTAQDDSLSFGAAVELLVRNQAVDNTISVEDVRTRMEEQYPLAVPAFEQALADSGVERNDRVTVSPSRIKKLESRSFKTESGIEIKIPAELCNSDDAVEFIHSATGGLSLLIKDVLV